jgi:hypothetical protein
VDGDDGVLGTQQGDWYLPTITEIIYIMVRWNEIKDIFDKLSNKFNINNSVIVNIYNHYIASSTLFYGNDFWYANGMYYATYGRDNPNLILPFLSV